MKIYFKTLVITVIFLLLAGCATPADIILNPGDIFPTPEDVILGPVESGIERSVEQNMPKITVEAYAPGKPPSPRSGKWHQYMIAHAQTVFSHSFTVGGLWPGLVGYEEGEWTEFHIKAPGSSEIITVKRALLKVREDGSRWWKLAWETGGKRWVYEGLIAADGSSLLRLRGKDPKGVVKEIPIKRGAAVNLHRRELTEKSIREAVSSTLKVDVSAGSFSARKAHFDMPNLPGNVSWWLNEDVPGGVVKYEVQSEKEGSRWNCELQDYGSGVKSELNSF